MEQHLNCVIQKTELTGSLASAQVHLRALADVGGIAKQEERDKALAAIRADYLLLGTQQLHLHKAIYGNDQTLIACARHIETQQKPFLTSELAPTVRDFYAAYESAALSLLTVRLNLMNDGAASEATATQTVHEVLGWITQERAQIKPALPSTESYYIPDDLVFKTRVAANGLHDL